MNRLSSASLLRPSSSVVLGVAFALTGAGTVMLGVLLPTLSRSWHLNDSSAGFLLFLQFLGSSLGAVLTGRRRVRALLLGYGILIVSAVMLALARPPFGFALFLLWGLGLGMAMTATSLYVSDRSGERRALNLERLNFVWSAGAMAAPVFLLRFLAVRNPRPMFFGFAGLFAMVAIWIALREREASGGAGAHESASAATQPGGTGFLVLVILAMFSVGVETALSGWLTTYSHRAAPGGAATGALATSCFWMGMLASRLISSTRLLTLLGRSRLLSLTLGGTAAATLLLIAAHHGAAIDAAAVLAGLSIGPLYPLLLSYLLEQSASGWIFAVAGLGSALFPWMTGVLSAQHGSLRIGLMTPLAGAMAMLVLRMLVARDGVPREARSASGA